MNTGVVSSQINYPERYLDGAKIKYVFTNLSGSHTNYKQRQGQIQTLFYWCSGRQSGGEDIYLLGNADENGQNIVKTPADFCYTRPSANLIVATDWVIRGILQ